MIAVIFIAVVVLLTHCPQNILPFKQEDGLDKLAHALVYGAITLLFILSLKASFTLLSAAVLFFAILAIGAIDELTQPFVMRTASSTDWLADIIGIFTTLAFFTCFKNSKYQTTTNADT